MLLLRIFILLIGAHAFVFLSGLIYHYLEQPAKGSKPDNVEKIVEQYLANANRPKKSKQEIVQLMKDAFAEDEKNHIRREFSSLWKCYLFALTTITTVGGLHVFQHLNIFALVSLMTKTGSFAFVTGGMSITGVACREWLFQGKTGFRFIASCALKL